MKEEGRMTRVLLLLARRDEDSEPCVIGAVDETIWSYWDNDDEREWRKDAERNWGLDREHSIFARVWAEFAPQQLVDAFDTPTVTALNVTPAVDA